MEDVNERLIQKIQRLVAAALHPDHVLVYSVLNQIVLFYEREIEDLRFIPIRCALL